MQIVILAGGLGTRLGSISEDIPKSMILVRGKPFLRYQIELFRSNGIENIALCVGHLAEKIIEYFGDGTRFGVRIRYGFERNGLLGTAGALKRAEPVLEDTFFLTYGDSYLVLDYVEVMDFFQRSGKLGLMVVYKNFNRYDRSNIVIEDNGAKIVKVYDKKKQTPDMIHIDAGVSILKKEALAFLPSDIVVDLADLYRPLIQQRELLAYETPSRFYEIGSPNGLEEFRKLVELRMIPSEQNL